MDFNERVIPQVTANFLFQEALARYHFALETISKSKLILDVGCGTGYGTAILATKGTVIGIDIDPEAVIFAQKNYPQATFITGSALKLPFPNHQADAVISFETIEHFPQTQKFISEVFRVLKKKGLFILSTPNGQSNSPYHAKYFTQTTLTTTLKKNFRRVRLFGQFKSPQATAAFQKFLNSQSARQTYVNSDVFNLRKLLPKSIKEKLWTYIGALHGRNNQEQLTWKNFPVTKKVENCEYLLAVCQK